MNFNFLQEVGESITWAEFSAQCWNLALLYFAWDIVKYVDMKLEKIFKRMGKDSK